MNGILLRIFSGMHLGAEIELCAGSYAIGSDDSCDIILNDPALAGRHAVLSVSFAEGGAAVEAEALDGSVLLDGTPIAGRTPIGREHPFQLASVFFAWTMLGADSAQAWAKAEAALAGRIRPESSPADGSGTAEGNAPDPGPSGQEGQAPEVTLTEKAEESPDSGQKPRADDEAAGARVPAPSRFIKWLVLPAALCLLALLCFSVKQPPDAAERIEAMRSLLREAGYEKLDVSERLDGVAVSGRIASDAERAGVLNIAQKLDFPVYLNLAVHSDTADAVRASYNAMALYPEVTEQPAPTPGISIRGYIRDAVLEEQALDAARRNVPILTTAEGASGAALSVHSDIRHMEDIQDILEPALAARRLRFSVTVDYLPGRILMRGALSPKSKEALRETAAEIQQKLGIPIPFDIINTADAARLEDSAGPAPAGAPRQPAAQASPAKPRMSFKVTSVSMGPMKYLILDSGERVFEGAELPGGYILEGIGVDKLILSKNNTKTSYPLKGGTD